MPGSMAPPTAAISGQLRQLIHYHLDNASYDNALFFAERYVAHDPRCGESAYLLALSHHRLGDFRSAYDCSKATSYRGLHLGCSFIFAQTCLVLERYREGITALEKSRGLWMEKNNFGKHSSTNRAPTPDTASVACLLGKLYQGYGDKFKSILCYEESLKANPFMWDAFTALCDMGVNMRTSNVFKFTDPLMSGFEASQTSGILAEQKDSSAINPLEPVPKKPSMRSTVLEATDPFEAHRGGNEMPAGNNNLAPDMGENDFMSRIHAARSRMAANTVPGSDVMETPTAVNADIMRTARVGFPAEPSQGAPRKRPAQATETNLADAPPKMSYGLGSRRNHKAPDKGQDDQLEVQYAPVRSMAVVSGLERKRTVSGHPVQPRQVSEEPGAPRRSTRIHMFKSTNAKANSGAATIGAGPTRELKKARPPISQMRRPQSSSATSVGRVVSGNRKPMEGSGMDVDHAEAPRIKEPAPPPPPPAPKPVEPESGRVGEALKFLLEMLQKCGAGYLALSQFQCRNALLAFEKLSRAQKDTPWVLSQQGRAHNEMSAWSQAEECYRRLRILAPSRLQDMEVYSTTLWFLKKETECSFLAHELVDSSWHSPQAWCALGNAWSLSKDHEQALRCFKRATQLNPNFAYAFTLQGHEHVANEEYEKALTSYRQAISTDRRHYNAYYGMGRVYEKLGNYDKASSHYRSASVINPTNAVLICCIGSVLEKQGHTFQALQYYTKATELAPDAVVTRYKKARVLLALNELNGAQVELEKLLTQASDESTVHFLMGKLYKLKHEKSAAVRHFTIAMNLDPKASQQIKEAIENLDDDDSYQDSMMA